MLCIIRVLNTIEHIPPHSLTDQRTAKQHFRTDKSKILLRHNYYSMCMCNNIIIFRKTHF